MFTFYNKNHNKIEFNYIYLYYDEDKVTEYLTFQSTNSLMLCLGVIKYNILMQHLEKKFSEVETGPLNFNCYSVFFNDSILLSSSCSSIVILQASKHIESARKRKENLKFSVLCSDFKTFCGSTNFTIAYEKDDEKGCNKVLLVYNDYLIAYENNEQTFYQDIGKREVTIKRNYKE